MLALEGGACVSISKCYPERSHSGAPERNRGASILANGSIWAPDLGDANVKQMPQGWGHLSTIKREDYCYCCRSLPQHPSQAGGFLLTLQMRKQTALAME